MNSREVAMEASSLGAGAAAVKEREREREREGLGAFSSNRKNGL